MVLNWWCSVAPLEILPQEESRHDALLDEPRLQPCWPLTWNLGWLVKAACRYQAPIAMH